MNIHHSDRGFIALISVILISAVLSLVILDVSTLHYSIQNQIQAVTKKEQSMYLAKSCMKLALFNREEDSLYTGDEILTMGKNTCTILPFENTSQGITITTIGMNNASKTTLKKIIQ